ncbi:hypothetical protein LC085_10860 [Bacillus tianshenii]|uniref:N-acetylmuramoyl-L-alanine amidase family protein n=1 Tax=Sutcliffiella tianshenii TaxID=1463404 RepID=UPI001CD76290|nr:N-acetylmuramoyl-L-alanine amidase family protein [Bacillus tianshenii]MCA1320410.1 hypothetical protein [Bacillus tianshenii]
MRKYLISLVAVMVLCFGFQASDADAATGWVQKNGQWSYYNESGTMHKGWLLNGGSWYFMDSKGIMKTGWIYDGGWYYMKATGAMATGWVQDGDSWYYMAGNGRMMTGWIQNGGAWYYLNTKGVMATGWTKVGNDWYYMAGSGKMQTGWLRQGNTWYYLFGSGKMATGWQTVQQKEYYFYGSGIMAANTTIDGKLLGADGAVVGGGLVDSVSLSYTTDKDDFQLAKGPDGTSYKVEGESSSNYSVVAVDAAGKLKWRRSFANHTDVSVGVTKDGAIYVRALWTNDSSWYLYSLNPSSGADLWWKFQQGRAFYGINGKVLIPSGTNLQSFTYYHNGQAVWTKQTPSSSHQVFEATFASNGTVAVRSSKGLADTIQVFDASGKELVTISENGDFLIGQVLFNDNSEILITKMLMEDYQSLILNWYSANGSVISQKALPLQQGYLNPLDGIKKVDNSRNLWYRSAQDSPHVYYKYNATGTLVAKTSIPTDWKYYTGNSERVVYFKYDGSKTNYRVYTFK